MIAAAGLEPVRPAGLHPHRTGKPCGELLSTCKGVEFQAGYSFEYSIFFFFFFDTHKQLQKWTPEHNYSLSVLTESCFHHGACRDV